MSLAKLRAATVEQNTRQTSTGIIFIDNSFCKTEGFDTATDNLITQCLTYDDEEVKFEITQTIINMHKAKKFGNNGSYGFFKHKLEELNRNQTVCWYRDGTFPTGHISLVTDWLNQNKKKYEIRDLRKKPVKTVTYKWLEATTPRYYQSEMVTAGITEHRGVFVAAVGSGKSYIMRRLILELGVPSLVILPSKDLMTQTYDLFVQTFGTKMVGLIESKKFKSSELKPVRLVTIQTLYAALDENIDTILKDQVAVFIDEFHHSGSMQYTKMLPHFNSFYYKFGFTGTFLRNDSKTLDMWGFLANVLYTYSAIKATEEGYLTPLKLQIYDIQGRRELSYQREYNRNYCLNEDFFNKIVELCEDLSAKKKQVLVLVGRKDKTGKVIHELLLKKGVDNRYVSGDNKRDEVKGGLRLFNEGKVQVLIGSSVIGEGIDVRSTDYLIMANGGKSEIQITQAVGRAVRLYPGKKVATIIDFRFLNTKYLEKHTDKRLKLYKKNFNIETGG